MLTMVSEHSLVSRLCWKRVFRTRIERIKEQIERHRSGFEPTLTLAKEEAAGLTWISAPPLTVNRSRAGQHRAPARRGSVPRGAAATRHRDVGGVRHHPASARPGERAAAAPPPPSQAIHGRRRLLEEKKGGKKKGHWPWAGGRAAATCGWRCSSQPPTKGRAAAARCPSGRFGAAASTERERRGMAARV